MITKSKYLIPLIILGLAACSPDKPDGELSASEEQAQMESASDYAVLAASAPPPDMLPDDYASGEAVVSANGTQTVTYHSGKETVVAVYDSTGDMPVARLKINGGSEVVLKQTDALPQGAVYGDDNTTWETEGTQANLTYKGKTRGFTEAGAHAAAASGANASAASSAKP